MPWYWEKPANKSPGKDPSGNFGQMDSGNQFAANNPCQQNDGELIKLVVCGKFQIHSMIRTAAGWSGAA